MEQHELVSRTERIVGACTDMAWREADADQAAYRITVCRDALTELLRDYERAADLDRHTREVVADACDPGFTRG